jgi:uncharacterized protein YjaG (DUF416 family)
MAATAAAAAAAADDSTAINITSSQASMLLVLLLLLTSQNSTFYTSLPAALFCSALAKLLHASVNLSLRLARVIEWLHSLSISRLGRLRAAAVEITSNVQ